MNPRQIFGSRLYNQIVVPLLVASVTVGIVAALVTVYFLRDLTDRWTNEVADAVASSVVSSYGHYSDEMQRLAWLASVNPALQSAALEGNPEAIRSALIALNSTLDFDDIMVLDEGGAVLAAVDSNGLKPSEQPIGSLSASSAAEPRTVFARLNGYGAMVAVQPIILSDGTRRFVALARIVDDAFLKELAGDAGSGFCFYGPDARLVACSDRSAEDTGSGAAPTHAALSEESPELVAVLDDAVREGSGVAHVRINAANYVALARRVELVRTGSHAAGDLGYVVALVSEADSDEAARTTANLIIIWSVVAVASLVGLGGWVARRVSESLVELSAGAARIAEGDFSTKVVVHGTNEIAQLGEAFNDMTDSLRDRSEALTKKVLELATLYEMSRALGSTLDMDELLGSVLDSALRIFDLDMGYVTLRDRETEGLSIRAVRGTSAIGPDALRASMSEWVVREGRPLIFNPDSAGEGRVDAITGARAALCVPLVSSEGTIGAITVGSADADYRFNSDDVRLLSTIANHVAIAVGNIELFTSLQEAYLATVRSLAAAVDAKDSYTRGHSDRVAAYSTLIAERLGVSHEERVALEMAAYLHDIGKIGVAEGILLKPGSLTPEEMEEMRHHPLIGANILKPVAFPWAITPIVRHHHEHFDGTGYPAGLKGEEIPLLARVLTAADSFEAMTSDRPYREGFAPESALKEMRECAGTQFDPRIVDVLVEIVAEETRAAEDPANSVAEISHEEARAIFSALVDGVLSSFARLGGPQLARNVATELNTEFEAGDWPFRLAKGRVTFPPALASDPDTELEQMRRAMRLIDVRIGRVTGATLVDHFYTDAYEGFTARMRSRSDALGFRAVS
ncbi:MAG: HD domain-containing protein [Coriobacteriia bacterium]|nr:HD domain-containing protein [Coriobacteriia bacterium]